MTVKNYFRRQFQTGMFGFEYDNASDFHVSCFQKNRTTLPLLFIRAVLFFGCIGIIITSFILTAIYVDAATWFIYMTHWGLVLITLTCGFAFGLSVRAYFKGPIDATFGLPWYIKVYWALYTTTIPIALFITIFYWIFLSSAVEEFAVSIVLDVFIHAVNSVLMLILLLTARHPTNLLHFYFPILFAVIYTIFTAIYYAAGGTDPFGNSFIYPVLDWTEPGTAFIMIAFSALLILILHFIVAMLTVGRDAFARSCRRENSFKVSS